MPCHSSPATSICILTFNPIEDWRALAEVRFTNAPQGNIVSYGGLAGTFDRTNTEQFDPHGTAPNAPMWGGYTVIEQAWIEWGRYQAFRLRVGNWFTPFGIWNVDHGSPTLISMAMPQFMQQKWMPLRQTGVQALGSFFSGETEIAYRAWVSNGRTEDNPFDYDNEKSFGARVFVKRDTGENNFQIGATYHHGTVQDQVVNVTGFGPVQFQTGSTWEYTEDIGGLDVSVDLGDTRIRSEGIISRLEYTEGKQEPAGGLSPGAIQPNKYRVGAYLLVAHQLPWYGLEPYFVRRGQPAALDRGRWLADALGGLERALQPERVAQAAIREEPLLQLETRDARRCGPEQRHHLHGTPGSGLLRRRTMLKRILQSLAIIAVLNVHGASAGSDEIVVIVHKDNPVSVLEHSDLRPIFQTTKTEWPNGSKNHGVEPTG